MLKCMKCNVLFLWGHVIYIIAQKVKFFTFWVQISCNILYDQSENEKQNIIRKQQKLKLELYSNIKSSYRHETYIDDVEIYKLENALHRLDCLLMNFQ